MPVQLLNLFKYLLIVLIWLFFLRVLRAIWVESRPERNSIVVSSVAAQSTSVVQPQAPKRQKAKRGGGAAEELKLVVTSGVALVPGREFAVEDSMTIGRGQGCTVAMVKDTFASSVHARVFRQSNELYVEDLDSTNGTFVNGKKVSGSQIIVSGDRLQIGQTIFEVSL